MTPEPETDQGRWLLSHQGLVNISKPADRSMRGDEIDLRASIATIESEARAAVLAEINGFTFPWADYIEPGVDDALLELAAYLRRDTLSDGGPTDEQGPER